ncbi:MAG: tyrosine-type recombinase/integrase [Sideroxydans sp.]
MKNQKDTSLAIYLESFFRNRLVSQRRCSPATVATYRDALRLLLIFAAGQTSKAPSRLSVEDLDRDRILAFLDHLENERGNSVRTRNARLAAVKSFFQHIAYCDPAAVGVVQRVLAIREKRTVKKVISYLRQEDLSTLLAAPDQATWQGRRDYTLLLFLSRTGARVSEATGVNNSDLRLDKPYQVLLRGKGSKERVVPLTEETVAALRNHRDENRRYLETEGPFFLNARGGRLTRFGVVHLLDRAVKTAAVQNPHLLKMEISPHTMRHTVAMHLLQAGVDLTTIQSWLGHVTVNTTHQYVEADIEMKRRAIEMCAAPETTVSLYVPTDDVLALLESLKNLCVALRSAEPVHKALPTTPPHNVWGHIIATHVVMLRIGIVTAVPVFVQLPC